MKNMTLADCELRLGDWRKFQTTLRMELVAAVAILPIADVKRIVNAFEHRSSRSIKLSCGTPCWIVYPDNCWS